jgi:glycosyltransferase involved in cell wall biosynthesis
VNSIIVSLSKLTSGGPSTFISRFSKYLNNRNIKLLFYGSKSKASAVLVISGTKKLAWLIYNKMSGKKIVQRLDGFQWKHKYEKVSFIYYLKCQLINLNMYIIRKYIADHVVYQSAFLEKQWNRDFGMVKSDYSIIHNAADQKFFDVKSMRKKNPDKNIEEKYKIICVEGTFQNDQVTQGMLNAIEQNVLQNDKIDIVELYGNNRLLDKSKFNLDILNFKGEVKREEMHKIYLENNLIFFMLEINPPCPNSLIEAICAGIPSISYDTGAFKELIKDSGIAIQYKGDPSKLEFPDYKGIESAISYMIDNYHSFEEKTNLVSENYRIDKMGRKYLNIFQSSP